MLAFEVVVGRCTPFRSIVFNFACTLWLCFCMVANCGTCICLLNIRAVSWQNLRWFGQEIAEILNGNVRLVIKPDGHLKTEALLNKKSVFQAHQAFPLVTSLLLVSCLSWYNMIPRLWPSQCGTLAQYMGPTWTVLRTTGQARQTDVCTSREVVFKPQIQRSVHMSFCFKALVMNGLQRQCNLKCTNSCELAV